MTIPAQVPTVTLNGNSILNVFNFSFEIPFQADGTTPAISVFTTTSGVNTPLVLGTDYSILGTGNQAGGSISYPLVGSPLPTGSTITISRNLFYTQSSAFPNESFLPESVEIGLDNLELQIQQLNARLIALGG